MRVFKKVIAFYNNYPHYTKNKGFQSILHWQVRKQTAEIFLYDYEYCVPTVINMTLKEFLASDLYIGKEEINIKPRDIGIY